MKISYKLILIFIFIALLPGLSVGYLSFQKGKFIIFGDIKKHLFNEADRLLEMIDRTIQSRQQEVIALSENFYLRNEKSSPEEIKKELLAFKKNNPDYVSLSFFNMSRVRLADTENFDIGKQHQMVPYWEDILLGKVSAGRDIHIAEDLKIPIIYFAALVYNNSGKPIGAVVASYDPRKIFNLIISFEAAEKERKGIHVILITKEKDIIFSNTPFYEDKILKEKMLDLSAVRQATEEDKQGVIEEFYPPQEKNALITFVKEKGFYDFTGNDWVLITVSDIKQSFAQVIDFRNQIFILGVFVLIFSIGVGFVYGRIIARPIEKLTDVAQKVAAGNLEQRVNIKNRDESGYLAKIFNQMLDNIENSQEKLEKSRNELEEKLVELERFQDLTVGREFKMIELKKTIEKLKEELNKKNA